MSEDLRGLFDVLLRSIKSMKHVVGRTALVPVPSESLPFLQIEKKVTRLVNQITSALMRFV